METLLQWLDEHRWRAAAIGGLLLGLYVVVVFLMPRLQALVHNYRGWQADEGTLSAVATWPQERMRVQAQRRHLEARFAQLYVSLPRSDQMSTILEVLQTHALETTVSIKQVRPGDRLAHANYDDVPFELELQGSFHALSRFVHRIEQSQYLMKVMALTIDPAKAPTPDAPLLGTLSLQVSILKEHPIPYE